MSAAAPYICFRCMRASAQLARSNTLHRAIRPYHGRAPVQVVGARPRAGVDGAASKAARAANRSMTSSRPLRKPTVEPHGPSNAESPSPPPPPPASSAGSATSSASSQYATRTLLNPRTDEETGEPMSVSMTPRAIRRLSQIMAKDSNPNLALRVTVESGGCHGFQYLMSLVDTSKIDESEDVLFVASTPEAPLPEAGDADWRTVAEGRPKVVIDESSLELLKGSKVDYTMELIGSQFKIDNPRASSSCGCGTSFDVKV
ncbi:uncharacterized protein PV09_01377 [Verruconis gallopava]|uniref:Uncharacterized protein n=1 Tax=Verruconis gallopava TaxID=253628 RepID=A0A0D2APM1_9PEZI|nr:uncharacterized protein PV09_01377 [Verruconis gallopava]KIW08475.1 hypothetical protein PV09_01377 [Verruconis gallopava]